MQDQVFVALGGVVEQWMTERKELLVYLASIFVNENAHWIGEGETYVGIRDLKK